MVAKPQFIMVPPLYEESTAVISWENMAEAKNYELDIVLNEDFDTASWGKSWADLELADWTWSDQNELSGLTWKEIEALPAQGLMWRNLEFMDRTWGEWDADTQVTWRWIQEQPVSFTIYSGPGEDIAAPDQGLTWADINQGDWTWGEQEEDKALSWKELSLLPSKGLAWWQHDQNGYTWEELHEAYPDWATMEDQAPRALCWGSLNAQWLTWEEIQQQGEGGDGFSWWEMEHLPPDNQTHKGMEIDIPLYTKISMLRLRALDDQNTPGEYIITALIQHLPRSLAKYMPPCLHIPTLYEGKPAQILWGDLYGASGYILERKLDKEYETRYDGPGSAVPHPADCSGPKEHYHGPDCKQHLACTDQIPYYQKSAQYRIKGYNTTDSSQYLESATVPIIPVFYRDDKVTVQAKKGQTVYLALKSQAAYDFDKIILTLRYNSSVLELVDVAAQTEVPFVAVGKVPDANISVLSLLNGEIGLQFTNPSAKNSYSGLITLLEFKGLLDGKTEVVLQ